ncbi:MAG: hypothetical protein DHS20C17_33100 [Cyclobacteriaceae bacterium]|nr:MAG: hypothetical protein DHS20C17_33100 [Cyclobacteriaceae bacterium]
MGLSTLPDSNALHLIENVFIGSTCFDISEASISGTFGQVGQFSGGENAIGFEEGIMISTGDIANAEGPNGASNTSTRYDDLAGDPDLTLLSGGSEFQDVATIEFDFIPTVSSISFDYVFASEEFCEFVNFDFNDLFGFFISGPGINGPFTGNAENIALIPQSDTYVSINTVNHLVNSNYYQNNIPLSQGQSCNNAEGIAVDELAFDGFTTILKATAEVIPCETYHIKIVVGDRGDDRYDSAVFLRGNSFAAGSDVTTLAGVSGLGSNEIIVYEGCNNGFFDFERKSTNLNEEVVVHFSIASSSTAVAGQDYLAIPDSVIIPAGAATFRLPIIVLTDNINNEMDVLTIDLYEACNCEGASASLNIFDAPPLQLFMSDITVCDGSPANIAPLVIGGIPGYTYSWNDGSSEPSLVIPNPSENQVVQLTVTDDCGQEVSGSSRINSMAPSATLSGSGILCEGHMVDSLQVLLTGSGPFEMVYTLDGVPDTLTNIQTNNFKLPVQDLGSYELIAVSANGCEGTVSGQVEVVQQEVSIEPEVQQVTCHGAANGAINLQISGGTMPYDYTWNQIPDNSASLTNLDTGYYQVTVVDQIGCFNTTEVQITEPNALSVDLLNLNHVDCGSPTGTITITASGGTGDLTYNWNISQDTDSIFGLQPGQYDLVVQDENGCEETLTAIVEDRIQFPIAILSVSDTLDCVTDQVVISSQGSSQGPEFDYLWINPNNEIIADSLLLSINSPGEYQFIISNNFNHCLDTAAIQVIENRAIPFAEAGPTDSLTCRLEMLNLDANNSSQGQQFRYFWTTTTGNIVENPMSLAPSVNATGIYILEVLNETNGCRSEDSVLITENRTIPFISFGPVENITCSQPTIDIPSTGSSQGPNYSYHWNTINGQITSPSTAENITVGAGGTYFFEITDQSNGCKQTDSITIITDQVFPTAIAGPDLQLNCAAPSLPIQAEQSSNGPDFDITWNTIEGAFQISEDTLSPTVDQTGIFELQITDLSNGCVAQDTVAISSQFETPIVEIEAPSLITCQDTIIELQAGNSSQGPLYSYQWTSQDGHILQGENSLNPNIAAIGTYQLFIIHEESFCADSASVVVNQDITTPVVSIEAPETLNCLVLTTTLEASSPGNVNDLNYFWYSDDANILGPIDSFSTYVNNPGAFYLLVTDNNNGCTTTVSTTVSQNVDAPLANAGIDQHLDCAITSTMLDGSNSSSGTNFSHHWYNINDQINSIANTETISVTEAGAYLLEVTNGVNSCITFDTVNVSIDTLTPIAEAGFTDSLTCIQNSLSLDGSGSSTGPLFEYLWFSQEGNPIQNETSLSPTIDQTGIYQLTVLNTENNCVASDEVQINIDTLSPILSIAIPGDITCNRPSLLLEAVATGGSNFFFNWQSPNGNILENADSSTPLIGAPGQYEVSVTNLQNGCISQASTIVEADTLHPVAHAGEAAILNCAINSLSLDGSQSSSDNVQYQWSSPDGHILSGSNTNTALIDAAATYYLLVQNLNNGCQSTDSVLVSQDTLSPGSQVSTADLLTCKDTLVTLQGSSELSNPGLLFQWTDPAGNAIFSNLSSIEVNEPGQYQLQITNPENHCSDTATVIVQQNITPPIAEAGLSGTLNCTANIVELNGEASSTGPQFLYHWTSQDGHIVGGATDLQATVDTPGLYFLTVENTSNGCRSTDEVEVSMILPQTAKIEIQQPNCTDGFGSIAITNITNGMEPFLYSIDAGEHFFTATIFNQLEPGDYEVVIQDANACLYEESATLFPPTSLEINLAEQFSMKQGDTLHLMPRLNIPASEIQHIQWSPAIDLSCNDCLSPLAYPSSSTTYHLQVSSVNECTTETKVTIVVDKRHAIFIPNIFSPLNKDGINDRLEVFAKQNTVREITRMQIFNRWGSQVFLKEQFAPNDASAGWDGTFRGRPQAPGVYVYLVEIELIDGRKVVLKGDVALVD